MSEEPDLPADPTSPADEPEPPALSPSESAPAEPPRTPLEVVIPLIRDLEKSQIEMKKWFLRQFTQMLRDHNQMIQQLMSFQQQITEISRRCHILQDWMMSPVRIVPSQVLQDNTMNIDQLHELISERPSDNDPWSVQLLELIDPSIAAHFPHFDFPHWESGIIEPRNSTDVTGKPFRISRPRCHIDSGLLYTISRRTSRRGAVVSSRVRSICFPRRVTEDGIPSPSAPPFQEDDEIPPPSPVLEQPPSQDVHYPAPTEQQEQQDRDDDIPSPPLHPSLTAVETADLFDEEPQQVLEVTDCSPEFEAPQRTRKKQTWQSVPSSEIEQSELYRRF